MLEDLPEILVVSLFRSINLRCNTGRVVCSNLCGPCAAGPGTHFISRCHQTNSFESGRVIRSYGRGNDIEKSRRSWSNPNRALSANESGTEVKRVTLAPWDPSIINLYKLGYKLDQFRAVECLAMSHLRKGANRQCKSRR